MLKQTQTTHQYYAKPILLKKNRKNTYQLSTTIDQTTNNLQAKPLQRGHNQSNLLSNAKFKALIQTITNNINKSSLRHHQLVRRKSQCFIVQNKIKQTQQSNINSLILRTHNYQLINYVANISDQQKHNKQCVQQKYNSKLQKRSTSSNLITNTTKFKYNCYNKTQYKNQRKTFRHRNIDNIGTKQELNGWQADPCKTDYQFCELF